MIQSQVFIACLLLAVAQTAAMDCTFESSGATFDLSSLKNGNAAYTVEGHDFPGTTAVEKGYKYTYAVCANVGTAGTPRTCTDESEPSSPVYQTDMIDGKETCHTAARNVDSNAGAFSLLDPNNPASMMFSFLTPASLGQLSCAGYVGRAPSLFCEAAPVRGADHRKI